MKGTNRSDPACKGLNRNAHRTKVVPPSSFFACILPQDEKSARGDLPCREVCGCITCNNGISQRGPLYEFMHTYVVDFAYFDEHFKVHPKLCRTSLVANESARDSKEFCSASLDP